MPDLPSATFAATLTLSAPGVSRLRPLSAVLRSGLTLKAGIPGKETNLDTAAFGASFRMVARLDAGRDALGVADVLNEAALVWGLRGTCELQEHDRRRALHDLNRAMQLLWNRAPDRRYWTQGSIELTFDENETVLELDNEIQNIVGEAALASGRSLVPVGSISEIEQFSALFLDSGTASSPVAYYVERKNQAGHDPARCRIHITPAPTVETVVVVDAVFEPPRFGVNDISRNTPVPIPHRYAESLLLPVIRYYAAQYWQSQISEEQRRSVETDYREVAGQLGMADPLPGLAGDNRARREEAVA